MPSRVQRLPYGGKTKEPPLGLILSTMNFDELYKQWVEAGGPWDTLPDPTRVSRQIWKAIWPNEKWPNGWHVCWVERIPKRLGECDYFSKSIILSFWDAWFGHRGEVIYTLVHEFIHLRGLVRHDAKFRAAEKEALARIGLEPE